MDVGQGVPAARQRAGARRAEVLRRMDGEWEALQHDEEAMAACRRWAGTSPLLAGCRTLAEVLGRVPGEPDAVLLLLLRAAAAGDVLASRVVLEAMLPKAVLMASVDRAADVDDYVTALWCAIATYPVARRPTSVAANLALDTLKTVRRERRPVPDLAVPPHLVLMAADRTRSHAGAGTSERGPEAREVLARARAHGLVDPRTGDLLRSVYAEGLSGEAAALRHGLTPGALRSRCSRALRVLSEHRELLASPP